MQGSVFSRERPVFVAADDRRARWLRYGGAAAAVLACLWVAALAVGMLGTGRLPGISLPQGVRGAEHGSRERAPAKVEPAGERSPVAVLKRATPAVDVRLPTKREPMRKRSRTRRQAAATRRAIPIRPRNVADPAPPAQAADAPPAAQPAQTPAAAPPKQGWTRQRYTTPPGETRRAEAQQPAAPPAPAPAPATPQPAPEPPGQQKKADDPKPKG